MVESDPGAVTRYETAISWKHRGGGASNAAANQSLDPTPTGVVTVAAMTGGRKTRPGDVERPLPLTRRPGDGGRGQEEAASAVQTRIETRASGFRSMCAREVTDDVSNPFAKLITLRAGPQNRLLNHCTQPHGVGADDGARRDVVLGTLRRNWR